MNRDSVYEQLKIDEGVVYEIYLDHLGYKTFGVGHLVLESDPEYNYEVGEPVSVERVQECFDTDLGLAVNECVALYGSETLLIILLNVGAITKKVRNKDIATKI